jgi:predicted methyltransferase
MRRVVIILVIASAAYPQAPPEQDQRARQQYSRLTTNPTRDSWQMPDQVVAALGLKSSEVVATLGDGEGYFARRIAPLAGRVYVIDKNPALLTAANKEAPPTVATIAGTMSNLTSRVLQVDTILVANTLGQTADRVAFFRSLSAVLKPNGRVVVIDFFKGAPPPGLPAQQQITEAAITQDLNSAGFHFVQRLTFLPYQFFVIFQR